MFHKIMVAYDESPESARALDVAIDLARTISADVSVVTVIEPLPGCYSFSINAGPADKWIEERNSRGSALQARALGLTDAAGLRADVELLSGDEAGCIVECVKRHHSDLLVLGYKIHALLLGHTTGHIEDALTCALLSVK
jgi:nucleotide-binding universal stress UspA family protein